MLMRALFRFNAEEAGEVSISAGDTVTTMLPEASDFDASDGWVQVRRSDGKSGLVPRDYLELLADASNSSHESSPKFSSSIGREYVDSVHLDNSTSDIFHSDSSPVNIRIPQQQQHQQQQQTVKWLSPNSEHSPGRTVLSPSASYPYPRQDQDNDNDSFAGGRDVPVTSLYELAAEKSVYVEGDDVYDQISFNVGTLVRSDSAVDSDGDAPTFNAIAADSFLMMTSSKASLSVNKKVTTPAPSTPHTQGGLSDHNSKNSLNFGCVEPILSNAAARGEFDELSRRAKEYFDLVSANSSVEANKLLDRTDILSAKLGETLKTSNALLDNVLDLSEFLDAEKSRLQAYSKSLKKELMLEKSAKIVGE